MITLEEVKSFLRLDDDLDDNYITNILIPSAIGFVTNYIWIIQRTIGGKSRAKKCNVINLFNAL